MLSKYLIFFIYFILLCANWPSTVFSDIFIQNKKILEPYYDRSDVVMIASTGRSGSTLLYNTVESFAQDYTVLKTHILPPDSSYIGKILFIFSNPDKSVESAQHLSLIDSYFGNRHFYHMESSDLEWLYEIGDTTQQTEQHNLLAYDALGCCKQLDQWLYQKTAPSTKSASESQILAIKYENLWDTETIQAIKDFLGLDQFELPVKKERGTPLQQLDPRDIVFRNLYNVGTWHEPRYKAYDDSRILWELAPPYQFLIFNH